MGFAYVAADDARAGEKFAHVLHAVTVIVKHLALPALRPRSTTIASAFETSGIASARLTTATYEPYRIGGSDGHAFSTRSSESWKWSSR